MTTRPLLLIDIDGVLNPFVPAGRGAPDGFDEHLIDGMRVFLARHHGEWMQELAKTYELVWASSWEAECDRLIGQVIDAPSGMPFLTFPDRDEQDWLWKLPAVKRFVGEDRPVAWLDDDHGRGAGEWADQRQAPTLLVRTDPRIGWTDVEYRRIVDFAAEAPYGARPSDDP
jgi:hypothetical protein